MATLGRILIADDDPDVLDATSRALRKVGYEVVCAADAPSAVEQLRQARFDLLISDIEMPGNPELKLIKSLPELAEGLPVILITGYPTIDTAVQSVRLPVVAYLVKPVGLDELFRCVREAIVTRRAFDVVKRSGMTLEDWKQDLAQIERLVAQKPGEASLVAVDAFLGLTFRNILTSIADLKHLTDALASHKVEQETCQLLNCPTLDVLSGALTDTIDTLEKTKRAFKSKELGALRQRLEDLVDKLEPQKPSTR